jgi:hypothetical protein
MFPLEFPVGNTSLVVYVLSHLERIPAPAGAEKRAEKQALVYCVTVVRRITDNLITLNCLFGLLTFETPAERRRVLSNFLSEYLLEYSSLSTIVLSTLSTLNARACTFSLSHVLTPVCTHSKQLSNNRRLKIKLN